MKLHYFILPLLLTACGGGGGSSSNTAPIINTLITSWAVVENETTVLTVSASDAENDNLFFSLTGNDGNRFSISTSGALSFSSAPDFENPIDSNGDNVYEVNVIVSDGNLSTSQSFVVTVNNNPADDMPDGPVILGTKVIDGYISGANVFIDFNWNLQQDEGEPSAIEDTQEETYYFEEVDFAAIDNFTEVCARLRPRIAEIPEGALDAVRGTVDSPYVLYFFPWYGSGDGSNRANVTPLTSLFTTYLTDQLDDGLDAGISVSDGCATTANNIGTAIESRVNEVMTALEVFGIDPNDFYDDFIASGNEELQSFGETVANYLQLTYGVSLLLEAEYEISMRTQIDKMLIENLLASSIPEVFEFALFSETPEVDIGNDWTQSTLYSVYEIFGNADGQLLTNGDGSGLVYEPTLENLIQYTDFVARERMFFQSLQQPLFDNIDVLLESGVSDRWGAYRFIDMGTFEQADCLARYMERDDSEGSAKIVELSSCIGQFPSDNSARINLVLSNTENPERVNLDDIFSAKTAESIQTVYNKIQSLEKFVDTLEENDSLLLNGDYIELEIDGWSYRRTNNSDSIDQTCTNTSDNSSTSGSEAFNTCSANMPTSGG